YSVAPNRTFTFHQMYLGSRCANAPTSFPPKANSIEESLFRGENPLELLDVIQVVAGKHLGDALDGFFPALGVYAELFPLLGRERLQQRQVGFAQYAELLDRLPGVALLIVARGHPGILIESCDRRARRAQDQAHPPATGNFGICEMRQNLRDRPFFGRRPLAQFSRWHAFDQARKLLSGRCLYFQRLLPVYEALNPCDVLLWRFLHMIYSLLYLTRPVFIVKRRAAPAKVLQPTQASGAKTNLAGQLCFTSSGSWSISDSGNRPSGIGPACRPAF